MSEATEVELTLEQAMERALQHHRAGELDQAEVLYGQIERHAPDYADVWHFHGLVAMQRGARDEALMMIRKAIELAPTYAEAHNNLGNLLLLCEQREEAVQSWQRALELRPELAEAHFNLGRCYSASAQVQEALASFRRSLALNPRQTEAYQRMAALLYSCGRIEAAAEVYAEWSSVEPDNEYPRHMLAACTQQAIPARASDGTVRRVFDHFAHDFDAQLTALQYRAPALVAEGMKRVLGEPTGALDVLDAGCGTGLCAADLRRYARRLVGVDLSGEMIKRAQARGYDELVVAELTAFLGARPQAFDVIASADTVCYFGELGPLLAAAATALRPGGYLFFTVEHATDAPAGYRLHPHGRYSHTDDYARGALTAAGLTTVMIAQGFLRMEAGKPVPGLLVAAQRA